MRKKSGFGLLVACLLALGHCAAQVSAAAGQPAGQSQQIDTSAWKQWAGLPVRRIEIEGVSEERLASTRRRLEQIVSEPLTEEKVAEDLRLLFGTGLFDTIEATAAQDGDGVALTFRGAARAFIGRVTVDGARGATLNTQLERTGRLNAGTRYSDARMQQALDQMRQLMASNGFHEAAFQYTLTPEPAEQLVDISVRVTPGPQARVGTVTVTGDSGMTPEEFLRRARLRPGRAVDRDTVSRALEGVLRYYQRQRRLEADVKLESQAYAEGRVNFRFTANRGPIVDVRVDGARLSQGHIRRLVPIYEEGSVDEDLLNEGGRRIRNFFQTQGYFDVRVDHNQQTPEQGQVLITFNVDLGARRKVESVKVKGNRYFDSQTLQGLLSVRAANPLDRQGAFNQALVASDIASLTDVYRNNGFSRVAVTVETGPPADANAAQTDRTARNTPAPLTVVYHITEGPQQRVGTVTFTGNQHVDTPTLAAQMNTVPGQLLSPRNLAGDRDALMIDYMTRGFNEVRVDVEQTPAPGDEDKVNVAFRINEGSQTFVRKVLLTGLNFTRPGTVARSITVKAGDPLNQQALQETQRNLYDFALFNEVDTAVQNPNGGETEKTVLIQTVEARRWTLTYGAGFEAQTGTPQNNCAGYIAAGVQCSPNGRTGISLRGLASITRNNLFGREQSASIQGNYGQLEQRINLIYQYPHFLGSRKLGFTFTGGYGNSLAVTTYVASRLDAGLRLTQNAGNREPGFSRANTFIYEFDFRRVKVASNSLQVFPDAIEQLSTAVRVGGPGFTWIRDTRDNPVDARRGSYISFQEFLSASPFGAQAQFNRIDVTNSGFYSFGHGRFVLARNTRYGQLRAFGNESGRLIPLPERLYAGGATSLRGFSTNAAGPRDPQTGFPIGGAGALMNSLELRLPPPTLPYFGDTVSFVPFYDMGNIFTNAGDAWASALRVRQPDRAACMILTPPKGNPPSVPPPTGPTTSTGTQGQCSFNFFSQTPGIGLRYHTPVGPIRFDFSYNLNPPIYPVDINYSQKNPFENQHVGEASHFNFFFSLGQTF